MKKASKADKLENGTYLLLPFIIRVLKVLQTTISFIESTYIAVFNYSLNVIDNAVKKKR